MFLNVPVPKLNSRAGRGGSLTIGGGTGRGLAHRQVGGYCQPGSSAMRERSGSHGVVLDIGFRSPPMHTYIHAQATKVFSPSSFKAWHFPARHISCAEERQAVLLLASTGG